MREPLLFVRDDNYVDKEYEEPNERGVVVKRWGHIFCWSGNTVFNDGSGRPCYPSHGKTLGGQNQH
jgi:hypothetical protein